MENQGRRKIGVSMRLKICLTAEDGPRITLPIQYNHLLQGLIYTNLDRALSEWLHEEGHAYEQRRFKLFTFSRLFGRGRVERGKITFDGPIHFHLGAVDTEILGSLAEHLLKRPGVHLAGKPCRISEVAVEPVPEVDFDRPVRVKTLSPVTAYSTLSTPDGRKKTYYYSPREDEWSESLVANIRRKAQALGWAADVEKDLKGSWVRPRRVRVQDQKVMKFKGTVIKGWTGVYEVNLPEPYFWLAYDSGLGSKNGQGFGMVRVVG
jgi:CRISPR-associated endoribonuclease Cas6